MSDFQVKPSRSFRNQLRIGIISISFLIFIYLLILLLGLVFSIACIISGITLIILHFRIISIAFGLALSSIGVLILIFLFKFIFNYQKLDRSNLNEITQNNEPQLFKLLNEIVTKVGTKFPKKVYLSSDVSASVFYDNSFWSMFFPVRKNLQIGLGLINSVTTLELKSILSHEFGHFSQKSMKLGSYVYNMNQILYNMLFDNESFEKLVQSWGEMNFNIAIKIINSIQWVSRKLYLVMNKAYLKLSREMEFHADEIAANVTGYQPLKSSLLRLPLAEQSFYSVISFYDKRISNCLISENLYNDHTFAMKYIANQNNIAIKDNLPDISIEEFNKFNKSKLVIKNQWASHPTIEERIKRLESTNLFSDDNYSSSANNIFKDAEKTQLNISNQIFKGVNYQEDVSTINFDIFKEEFTKEYLSNTYSKIYNGYYDNHNPIFFNLDNPNYKNEHVSFEELFSPSIIDIVYTKVSLSNDIDILKEIKDKKIDIKIFDYDGKKYKRKESSNLISTLSLELEALTEKIRINDFLIYDYFLKIEQICNEKCQLKDLYQEFFDFDKDFDSKQKIYTSLFDNLQFVHNTKKFEEIRSNFLNIGSLETKLKSEIQTMLDNDKYKESITKEIKENFELYLSQNWTYFRNEIYFDKNLQILFQALNDYSFVLSNTYFRIKKKLLDYQEELLNNSL